MTRWHVTALYFYFTRCIWCFNMLFPAITWKYVAIQKQTPSASNILCFWELVTRLHCIRLHCVSFREIQKKAEVIFFSKLVLLTTKITTDDIWNNTFRPNTLGSGGGSPFPAAWTLPIVATPIGWSWKCQIKTTKIKQNKSINTFLGLTEQVFL